MCTSKSGKSVESVLKKEKKAMVGRICGKGSLKPAAKEWLTDDESGESIEEIVPVMGTDELESGRLVCVWQREASRDEIKYHADGWRNVTRNEQWVRISHWTRSRNKQMKLDTRNSLSVAHQAIHPVACYLLPTGRLTGPPASIGSTNWSDCIKCST